MNTGYRIYFNERPIRIIPQAEQHLWNADDKPGIIVIQATGADSIHEAIKQVKKEKTKEVWLFCINIDECCNDFKNELQFVLAGGGLVKNERDEYLFIFRRGKWDLPKGKLDEMESIEECALREVEEETGLQEVKLRGHLCDTHHIYQEKGVYVIKESVWFTMEANGEQPLIPQTEEGIHEIIWLAPAQWQKVLNNTYASVKDVLHFSGKMPAI